MDKYIEFDTDSKKTVISGLPLEYSGNILLTGR